MIKFGSEEAIKKFRGLEDLERHLEEWIAFNKAFDACWRD